MSNIEKRADFSASSARCVRLYDKLNSLPDVKAYLKPGLSFEILDHLAYRISDNQAADQLQKARQTLFKTIYGRALNTG